LDDPFLALEGHERGYADGLVHEPGSRALRHEELPDERPGHA
jgi:hypothetical protein